MAEAEKSKFESYTSKVARIASDIGALAAIGMGVDFEIHALTASSDENGFTYALAGAAMLGIAYLERQLPEIRTNTRAALGHFLESRWPTE